MLLKNMDLHSLNLSNLIQKLHKAAKWPQYNWDFMNKIKVKILQSGGRPMKIKKWLVFTYIKPIYKLNIN